VKRRTFLKELHKAGCELLRHGKRHDIYHNLANGRQATVPRHREMVNPFDERQMPRRRGY
jgi:hypothetical protein